MGNLLNTRQKLIQLLISRVGRNYMAVLLAAILDDSFLGIVIHADQPEVLNI